MSYQIREYISDGIKYIFSVVSSHDLLKKTSLGGIKGTNRVKIGVESQPYWVYAPTKKVLSIQERTYFT
jgi:hypothetical protein